MIQFLSADFMGITIYDIIKITLGHLLIYSFFCLLKIALSFLKKHH